VVVGGHTGGTSFLSQARRFSDHVHITLLERGAHVGYVSCGLAYYAGGLIPDRATMLPMRPATLERRFGIEAKVQHEVTGIDRAGKRVAVRDLAQDISYHLPYDKLVLAPGATALWPDHVERGLPGVFALRRIHDADGIIQWIEQQQPQHATVIGAGFIGLEAAENLRRRGLAVTVIERAAHVLPRIDAEMAALLHQHLAAHDVELKLRTTVARVGMNSRSLLVQLSDGSSLHTDMVVLALGLKADTALAESAGLAIGNLGGIEVDEYLRTSDPDIYALGDAIQTRCAISGIDSLCQLAGPIGRQARVAAGHMFGGTTPYRGSRGTFACKVFDRAIAMTGLSEKQLKASGWNYGKVFLPSTQHVTYYPGAKALFLKLLFDRDSGRVLGAQAIGEDGADKRIDVVATAIAADLTVEDLEYLELCYAPPYGAPKDAVNMAGAMAAGVRRGQKRVLYPEELDGRHDDLVVLDTRSADEYAASCIPGSVNIPDEEVRKRVAELPRDKRIAIVCQIGIKANNVQRFLELQGYEAYTVMGGYTAWMMAMDRLPAPTRADGTPAVDTAGQAPDRRARTDRRERTERRMNVGAAPNQLERRAGVDRRQLVVRRQPWDGAELDVRGLCCPGPILKVREQMTGLSAGQLLRVQASDPAFAADLESWAKRTGVRVVYVASAPNHSVAICEKRR
jgi:NADPH-dependent 2,4-dienoyl-CoA reductase/sulfur reductase-like enzyme/rhodanese-related sulfurtransferase